MGLEICHLATFKLNKFNRRDRADGTHGRRNTFGQHVVNMGTRNILFEWQVVYELDGLLNIYNYHETNFERRGSSF